MLQPVNPSDAAAVASVVKSLAKPEIVSVSRGSDQSASFVSVPTDMKIESVKKFLDEYKQKPDRVAGTSSHDSLNSLIMHVNTFKETIRSAIFADEKEFSVTAMYDYHTPGDARFLEHRAVFAATTSRQWDAWTEAGTEGMNQAEFANFIETNALDLINPPTATTGNDGDEAILTIAKTLNTTIASASKVLELARGISLNEASKAKSHFDPGSGQVQIEYLTEHQDTGGKKLTVPGLFLIAIPVFEKEHAYRIVVRLRYRLSNGNVTWFVNMYQPEKCVEDAFGEICQVTAASTGLTVYRGRPE